MNINDITTAWRDALAINPEITTWCQSKYGRDQHVFVGLNLENLPPDDFCPFIVVDPDVRHTGIHVDDESMVLGLAVAICDDSKVDLAANVTEYNAIQYREQFRQLVLGAAQSSLPEDCFIADVGTVYDPLDLFPQFWAAMTIEIKRPYQFRDERIV